MTKAKLFVACIALLLVLPKLGLADDEASKTEKPESAKPKLFHIPISEAKAAADLVIKARMDEAWRLLRLEVRYRRMGDKTYTSAELKRSATGGYSATLPAEGLRAPGVEYYIVSKDKQGAKHLHFAGPEHPHTIVVHNTPKSIRLANDLARHRGNRSRAKFSFEYVDFGARLGTDGNDYDDWFWKLGIDYTYRMFKWAYAIRFGYQRIRSESMGGVRDPNPDRFAICETDSSASVCNERDPGIDHGYSEVDFRFHDLVGLKLKILAGVSRKDFSFGAGCVLRLGYALGTHVALGVEGASDLGLNTFFRLAWDTVPGFPMAATVAVTNYPGDGDYAVQMFFDLQRRLFGDLTVALRAGYQARDFRVGGPTLGGWMFYEF
ncbi:MAG: hypothetical protein JRF33_14330 [Deltaproteobacteria bacterium]|nr:hypothetical protein [Deltaproteobacteria bacterium]